LSLKQRPYRTVWNASKCSRSRFWFKNAFLKLRNALITRGFLTVRVSLSLPCFYACRSCLIINNCNYVRLPPVFVCLASPSILLVFFCVFCPALPQLCHFFMYRYRTSYGTSSSTYLIIFLKVISKVLFFNITRKFTNLLVQLSIFLIDLFVGTYRLSSHARLEAFVIQTKQLCTLLGFFSFSWFPFFGSGFISLSSFLLLSPLLEPSLLLFFCCLSGPCWGP